MNPSGGAIIIGIGVFFLLIINVQWGEVPELVRAYTVLGAGLVCLAAFATAQGTSGDLAAAGAEVAHQVAGFVAAAIILGSFFASLGGFPFWDLMDEERGDDVSRELEIGSQVLTGNGATLSFDLVSVDLELVTWDKPEIEANGTIRVYGSSTEKANEYLNQTEVRMVRGEHGGAPTFTIEVDAPEAGRPLGYRGYKLYVTLKVPGNVKFDLDLACVSGDYTISDVDVGDAVLKTTSGDVVLEGIEGEDLRVNSVSGNIDGSVTFGKVELSTISGDVSVDLGEVTSACEVRTTSGDIYLGVPKGEDIGYSLEASTTSGWVDFDPEPLDYSLDKRAHKVGETPGFSGKPIRITFDGSTVSGNIRVRS
ncbi:MAG: DUF4097 family beta strand repeat protein [Theionarchaea archaeon]|nr:DUF4097 family beta strand repeat protein [Theionarchaea archaeon]